MGKIILDLKNIKTTFTASELINHPLFLEFIEDYFKEAYKDDRPNSSFFLAYQSKSTIELFKMLINKDHDTLEKIRSLDTPKLDEFLNFLDSIYDFWRKKSRYLVCIKEDGQEISHRQFVHSFSLLSTSIVAAYRDIYETVLGSEQTVYRVLPSGANAGVLLAKEHVEMPKALSFLDEIPLMESVVTQPPFIIKTKQNTRKGFFFLKDDEVTKENFDVNNAYGVLIDVYDTKGLVYFHKDYLGFLVALGNLFQVESYDPKKHQHVDFTILFGTDGDNDKCYYYKKDDMYVGVCPKKAKVDYFGYAKKMVLTLFNLIMIERKLLPIHGAGIRIRSGNKARNFVLLGDSGAGKSETLEAIKSIYANDYQIETIFDDMGTFHLVDGKVFTTGTEIGAFVRLDDLEQAYSLRSVDRAVYFNIDEANSRVVIPIEDFNMTYTLHHVDAFLLANNFTDSKEGIKFFSDYKEAMDEFIAGKRVAMNTTNEKGLVSTFFANPFGPLQKEDEVREFLPDYFKALFDHMIPVGTIYTRLSLDRKEGPKTGASALIDLFKKM